MAKSRKGTANRDSRQLPKKTNAPTRGADGKFVGSLKATPKTPTKVESNLPPLKGKIQLDYLVEQLRDAWCNPLPSLPKIERVKSGKTRVELAAILSDVHVGKLTPTYNLAAFYRRLTKLEYYLLDRIEEGGVEKLHITLNGDIVDGENIYRGHAHHIEMGVIQQYFLAADALAEFIRNLSAKTEVHVPCTVGNHGRMGQKGDSGFLANWDYLVYHYLKAKLEHNPQVHFHISDSWGHQYLIGGVKFFITHGDAIKGGGSKNTIENAVLKWANSIPFDWEAIVLGHFHQPYTIRNGRKRIFGNGTFVSDDPWALEELKQWVEPSQKVLEIDSDTQVIKVIDYPL